MVDLLKRAKQIDRTINKTVAKVTHSVANNSLYTDGGIADFKSLFTLPIGDYCLEEMARRQRIRLLSINYLEKNVTLAKLGDTTSGISNHVSDEIHRYDYGYTAGNNYLYDYQLEANKTTTQTKVDNNNYQNFHKEGHNTLYGITMNAYYDENDTGIEKFGPSRKLEYYDANNNRQSILKKTKQMFRDRKINTLVSRFHTDNEDLQHSDVSETARSVYGLSHGRNLLTYDAERNGVSYDTNGYNNPYCRVWTHHHQYSEYRSRMMRPFVVGDGENSEVVNEQDLHHWPGFNDMEYKIKEGYSIKKPFTEYDENKNLLGIGVKSEKIPEKTVTWGWKGDEGRYGRKYSVLNHNTGLVNITPKFLGGAEKNIHTKDCMFSIENLAWQGYDPYSFERALSWEQRGPFGGRIMWFPPYGLRFSEESSVNWNEHSFIGRGENVYTYTNTTRSGTLEFMMVVDHPSILDYATWHDPKDLKDTDVFRFFAGCDFGGGVGDANGNADNSVLKSFVKPTPLTDEYLEPEDNTDGPINVTENKMPESKEPKEPEGIETPSTDEEFEISFFVFFPNNYSGAFDRDKGIVDPISYLLFGKGAQWKCNDTDVTQSSSLQIDFDNLSNTGTGYEMKSTTPDSNGSLDGSKNYIVGTDYSNSKKYIPNTSKKWYYRIDGEYKAPINVSEIKNCFAQTLIPDQTKTRLKNTSSFKLNCDVEQVKANMSLTEDENEPKYFSLSEVAYALSKDKPQVQSMIESNCNVLSKTRTSKLMEIFNKEKDSTYKVTKISCKGYSNSHGYNQSESVNSRRNMFLATQRRSTVISWFKKLYGDVEVVDGEPDYSSLQNEELSKYVESSVKVKAEDKYNENALSAKLYRSAIATLTVKKSSVKETKDLNQVQSHIDENGMVVTNASGGSCPSGSQPYEYVYTGENKNIPLIVKAEELTDYIKRYPNEQNSFQVNTCGRQLKNTVYVEDYNNIEDPNEKSRYEISKYCLSCDDLYLQKEYSTKGFKILITKQEHDDMDQADRSLYLPYEYVLKNKTSDEENVEKGFVRFTGFQEVEKDANGRQLYINTNETNKDKAERRWYYDENTKQMKLVEKEYGKPRLRNSDGWTSDYDVEKYGNGKNSLRYDQEYYFFKQLETKHPDVFSSVVEKLQYFDPAFHSMTPEGFMGRLNFLHQCTRQGDTITASDKNGHMANNLAFGRPPFCILRLGDFYYQKIVIRNISINYDPLVLDLNDEGVGVVPLIANVTISFNFIGGGDLTGPVRRLQNAMAFNYYANGRLYDNRADRVERLGVNNWDTMDKGDVDFNESYFHHVKMSTKK